MGSDINEYWSHVTIEDLEGRARTLNTPYGPFHIDAMPSRPYLVLVIDVNGCEWLAELESDYESAVASAGQQARIWGNLDVIDNACGMVGSSRLH